MWYRTNSNKVYWITNSRSTNASNPLESPPFLKILPIRNIKPRYDSYSHIINSGDGNKYEFYISLDSTVIEEGIIVNDMRNYPKLPTYESLSQFLGSKEGTNLETPNFKLTKHLHEIRLSYCEDYLATWKDNLTFSLFTRQNIEALKIIEFYKKYGDPNLQYRVGNLGCWEVNSKIGWTLIVNGITFHIPTYDLVDSNNEISQTTKHYQYILKTINDYVDSLTPATIIKMAVGVPLGQVMPSRCMGCAYENNTHLKIHVQRKELLFYIVYSTYSEYAPEKERPLDLTWKLILECRQGSSDNVFKDFKIKLLNFLIHKMLGEFQLLRDFPPRGPFKLGWTNNKKYSKYDYFAMPTLPDEPVTLEGSDTFEINSHDFAEGGLIDNMVHSFGIIDVNQVQGEIFDDHTT